MHSDDTICYCFHVSKRKIINYIRVHRPRRASQVADCGGAGTGCGWCIPFIKKYFGQFEAGTLQPAEPGTLGQGPDQHEPTSAEEYAAQRAKYIREGHGRPAPGAIPLPPAD